MFNPLEIRLNSSQDLIGIASSKMLNKPQFWIACVFAAIARFADRQHVGSHSTRAVRIGNGNEVICFDLGVLKQSLLIAAVCTVTTEVFETHIPVVNGPINGTTPFTRCTPLLHEFKCLWVRFVPALYALYMHINFLAIVTTIIFFLPIWMGVSPLAIVITNAVSIAPIALTKTFSNFLPVVISIFGIVAAMAFLAVTSQSVLVGALRAELRSRLDFSAFGAAFSRGHSILVNANSHGARGQGGTSAASSVANLDHAWNYTTKAGSAI